MSIDLLDYVETLRREIVPAGTTLYANVTDDTLVGYLSDSFWQARLDGFAIGYTCDTDGSVSPVTGSADFPREQLALVVLYAGIQILRNQILNTQTGFRAKAGPVEFERQNSATMLVEMLKQLAATKERLIEQIRDLTPVHAFDALSTRLFSAWSYFGSINLTEF